MQVSMTLNVSADLQSLFTWNTKQVYKLKNSYAYIRWKFILLLFVVVLTQFNCVLYKMVHFCHIKRFL